MSRRKKAIKRKLLPDPKFHNVLAARFVNSLMKQGKKSVAERIFYDSIDLVRAILIRAFSLAATCGLWGFAPALAFDLIIFDSRRSACRLDF